jgi:hypothetical protein
MADIGISFNLDVREIVALADAVPAMRGVIEDEMASAMEESGMLLTAMVASRTPVNFGILRGSIEFPQGFEVRGRPADMLEGLARAGAVQMAGTSPRVYANYVEFGRRPGRWPPHGPILLWVMRKLGLEGELAERTTFLIRRKIGQEGTNPDEFTPMKGRMFQRAWDAGGRTRIEKIWHEVPVKAIRKFAGAVR